MINLLELALHHKPDLVVFPELALTSFFPYLWIEDNYTLLKFFEKDDRAIKKLKDKASEAKISIYFGYCEATDGQRKNVFEIYLP